MSLWLERVSASHRVQLAVTAILSGTLVGAAVIGLQEAKRRYNIQDLKESVPATAQEYAADQVAACHLPTKEMV